MYRETMNVEEETSWGTILADAARHIAIALHSGYGGSEEDSLAKMQKKFNEELANPTSTADGGFA